MFYGMTYAQNNKLWIHTSNDCYMRAQQQAPQPPELNQCLELLVLFTNLCEEI